MARQGKDYRNRLYSVGILIVTLAFVLNQITFSAFAQEQTGQDAAADSAAPVSEEVKLEVEGELTVSAEAIQEISSIDLKGELGLPADYEPIIPSGFWGNVMYPLKKVTWDAQEGLYNVFASDSNYADLVQSHANKELVAAAKLYTEDPAAARDVVGILEEYRTDLVSVKDAIRGVREENPEYARELSAKMAGDHMFMAPKILGTMQDAIYATDPESVPDIMEIKKDVIGAASGSIVAAAENEAEIAAALATIALENQATPFSGIINAEFLSQAKDVLGSEISAAVQDAFDQAIDNQLKVVEANINNIQAPDDVKADSLGKYIEQLPGQSLSRMKILDELKGASALPPAVLEKMQEAKAKLAETIGAKIQQVIQEEVKRAMSDAFLNLDNPNVADFKVLQEFEDLVPQEEVRKQVVERHEEQVQKFLGRFGDDENAQKVTSEFKNVMKKVENGQMVPDANFFKTLEELKGRLSPDQQKFITEMEDSGKREVIDRAQNDPLFAKRFTTYNPEDMQVYEDKFITEGFGPQDGPPIGFDFQEKFRNIEQEQVKNYEQYLKNQDRPENVEAIKRQFETNVSPEIKQRFEQQYNFNPQSFDEYHKFAQEKQVFFEQKYREAEAEFRAKYGDQTPIGPASVPGQVPTPFVGATGFFPSFNPQGQPGNIPGQTGTPGQSAETGNAALVCPPGTAKTGYGCQLNYERQEYQIQCGQGYRATSFGCQSEFQNDPAAGCAKSGGTWNGSSCEGAKIAPGGDCPNGRNPDGSCISSRLDPISLPYPLPITDYPAKCAERGGTWTGSYCRFGTETYQTPTAEDPAASCARSGGTWTGTFCRFGNYQTPYLTPSIGDMQAGCSRVGGTWADGYCKMPGEGPYPTPGTAYPTPGSSYPTPGTVYVTPPSSYPTPGSSSDARIGCERVGGTWTGTYCQMPGEQPYPTPVSTYPTPSTSYPTPGTSYPTPSTSYPTPSTSYPTPNNDMISGCASAGGTWTGSYCQMPSYPTPATSYPTPSTSYPTPYSSYPTPSSSYPTPYSSYPTPSYAYPTPASSYPTPSYSYPTPESYPTPASSYSYPTPSYSYPTPSSYATPYATPTGYSGGGQVAGLRVYDSGHDIGLFDFLALATLGLYGYRSKGKRKKRR